jgi:hypothetical protein
MDNSKLGGDLKKKCLEARITKLEGALLHQIRKLDYGQFTLVIHKIEGQPVRIEIVSVNSSKILNARDGLNLEGSTYVEDDNLINKNNNGY